MTWTYGPHWVPVYPRQRGGPYDYKGLPAHSLVQVMDRIHRAGTEHPSEHWLEWKAARPDVFGSAA